MAFFSKPLTRREMAVLLVSLLAGLCLCSAAHWAKTQLDTGAAVCAQTLRLHIRADSDTVADQTAKLRVRDAVLDYIAARCPAHSKRDALLWAAQNLTGIQLTALRTLQQWGSSAPVQVGLVTMYFPTRKYAGAALPAGRYQALRVDIGADTRYGKNWWCVLYPGLCRQVCGGYARQQETDLVWGDYLLRFRLVEWWQRRTACRTDRVLVSQ